MQGSSQGWAPGPVMGHGLCEAVLGKVSRGMTVVFGDLKPALTSSNPLTSSRPY